MESVETCRSIPGPLRRSPIDHGESSRHCRTSAASPTYRSRNGFFGSRAGACARSTRLTSLRQVVEERLVVRDVIVCPCLDDVERRAHALGHDDDDGGAHAAAANLANKGHTALILDLRFDNERADVRIVVNPPQRRGRPPGPRHFDARCNIAKSLGRELGRATLVRHIEDFHEACRLVVSSSTALERRVSVSREALTRSIWVKFLGQGRPRVSAALLSNAASRGGALDELRRQPRENCHSCFYRSAVVRAAIGAPGGCTHWHGPARRKDGPRRFRP